MKYFGFLTVLAVILTAAIVYATDKNFEAERKAKIVYKNLKCLVCEGQSVLDSESDFAKSLRLFVLEKFENNYTSEQIYQELREKYGDEIFFTPPINNQTIFLWVLPFFLIFAGFIAVVIMLRKKPIHI